MRNDTKLNFGRTLGSIGKNGVNTLTDCESYGMLSGCDDGCPVLNDGKCQIYNSLEEYLEENVK